MCTITNVRHPVRPETERRTAIRQTIPMKAPVEAETSTLINKRLFYWKNFTSNYRRHKLTQAMVGLLTFIVTHI